MTRHTLIVTWQDGRTERHSVPELGAVITLGPCASGIGPERIPVYRADGPTIAVAEVWGDEIPAIVAHEDTAESDLDVTPLAVGFDGEPGRDAYLARFGTKTDAVRFEERVLAIGSEFLPPPARAVRDGAEPSPEYWAWLCDQHAAVETEPSPTDTMRPLADQIRTATERVRERHAEQLARWVDCYVASGRALEAASRGDRAAALAYVEAAADVEYDLCGDCDTFGDVEGEAEVAP